MTDLAPGIFVAAVAVTAALLLFYYPARRRRHLLAQPFPAAWLDIIRRRLPFYTRFSTAQQRRLQELVRIFLDGRQFHGCSGQQMNDEVRVTIAAWACLLLLGRTGPVYPRLLHILVYPGSFRARREYHHADGTVSEAMEDLQGESWDEGKLILSWDDIELDCVDIDDGFNVLLHEFAHQLDSESGEADGTPPIPAGQQEDWQRIFSREYGLLAAAAEQEQETLLDPYGATDPTEFFAVATETYYEMPQALATEHPELFGQLQGFYGLDPRTWHQSRVL